MILWSYDWEANQVCLDLPDEKTLRWSIESLRAMGWDVSATGFARKLPRTRAFKVTL